MLNKNQIGLSFEQLFNSMEFLSFVLLKNIVAQKTVETI